MNWEEYGFAISVRKVDDLCTCTKATTERSWMILSCQDVPWSASYADCRRYIGYVPGALDVYCAYGEVKLQSWHVVLLMKQRFELTCPSFGCKNDIVESVEVNISPVTAQFASLARSI